MKKCNHHHVLNPFSGGTLTHFEGFTYSNPASSNYITRLLHPLLQFPQPNNRHTISEEMFALIDSISLDLGRMGTPHFLKQNGDFQYLTGLPTFPNSTTLKWFLFRMVPLAFPKLKKVHDWLLLFLILKPKPPARVIFDLTRRGCTRRDLLRLEHITFETKLMGSLKGIEFFIDFA